MNDPRALRFAFGANWRAFSRLIDAERVAVAERSLTEFLGRERLDGQTFLDVGAGSGLFSLAARRLGAKVVSFDLDPEAMAAIQALKDRFAPGDPDWTALEASILDEAAMARLGRFDIVYAWGSLHHSGDLARALIVAASLVAPGGWLLVSVYNDQGGHSARWRTVKRLYNRAPAWTRPILAGLGLVLRELRPALGRLLRGRNPLPLAAWRDYKQDRGMSRWHDWLDWLGGHPFETAKPEEIFHACRALGFTLERLKTCGGGLGCNEFLLRRAQPPTPPQA